VRQNFYSVPVPYAGRRLNVRLGANEVVVYDAARVIARHDPRPGAQHGSARTRSLPRDPRRQARSPRGFRALQRARDEGRFTPLHEKFWRVARRRLGDKDGTKALIEVLLLERRVPCSLVHEALSSLLEIGSLDTALVAIEARRLLERTPDVCATRTSHALIVRCPRPTLRRALGAT